MTFQTEFPDFPAADMPKMPAGFRDDSFRNDTCPSFGSDVLCVSIFVDYADVAMREFSEGSRFVVKALDEDGCFTEDDALIASDDWKAVLEFLIERAQAMIAAETGSDQPKLDALNITLEPMFEMVG